MPNIKNIDLDKKDINTEQSQNVKTHSLSSALKQNLLRRKNAKKQKSVATSLASLHE